MNPYFFSAGALAILVGAVHSVLGERLIFRHMRTHSFVPTDGGQSLRTHELRILWATWHIATVMGWGMAGILFWLARPSSTHIIQSAASWSVAAAMLASSVLVLVGTKGKHPGWVGLLGVATLTVLGCYA